MDSMKDLIANASLKAAGASVGAIPHGIMILT
jgi:hypothetical protein